MKRKGFNWIETFKTKDDLKVEIYLNRKEGKFLGELYGMQIEDSDLTALRKRMEDKVTEKLSAQWEPVLTLSLGYGNFPVFMERKYRAQIEGKTVWRAVSYMHGLGPEREKFPEEIIKNCVVGPVASPPQENAIIIPYDPVLWLSFPKLEKEWQNIVVALRKELTSKNAEKFLRKYAVEGKINLEIPGLTGK